MMRGLAIVAALLVATGAQAQDVPREPRRVRVALGPQMVPSFPGADDVSLRPLVDVAIARGDTPFEFEAPDESFGPDLIRGRGFQIGPAVNFEGKRSRRDTAGLLPSVGFTVELGGFVQYDLGPAARIRAEVRQGVGGHEGLIGVISADYVARDADRWLVSLGPRLTVANRRYHRAYFGVATPAAGLPRFDPDAGVQAVGAAASFVYQLSDRWGLYGYGKYDRLVADPARSPVVRRFGSRDQLSGGLALTFTLGGRRDR